MEHKKDIGKAFREKLDLLEKTPANHTWSAIESELPKKKKRRMLPFWLTFVSIVVIALLLFIVTGDFGSQSSPEKDNPSGTVEGQQQNPDAQNATAGEKGQPGTNENPESGAQPNETNSNQHPNEIENKTGSGVNANASGTKQMDHPINSAKNPITVNAASKGRNNTAVKDAFDTSGNHSQGAAKKGKRTSAGKNNSENTVANATSKDSKFIAGKNRHRNKKSKISQGEASSGITKGDKSGKAKSPPTEAEMLAQAIKTDFEKGNTKTAKELGATKSGPAKKDSVAAQNDSVAKAIAENELKKKEKDKDTSKTVELEESNYKTFGVFLYAAPTSFNFFNKKSSMDRVLDSLPGSSQIVYNYGGYLCFQYDEKWSVRVGIASTVLKYTTKGIRISEGGDEQNFPIYPPDFYNIDYSGGITNEVVVSQLSGSNFMELEQELSYMEFPIELKYKFFNKGLSIEGIGGMSTLILKDNVVTAKGDNGSAMIIGSTKDIFKAHFSANLGVGFSYSFLENFKLNVEPMFKYHFKVSDVAQQPYSLLLQAGIEYTFNSKKKVKKS